MCNSVVGGTDIFLYSNTIVGIKIKTIYVVFGLKIASRKLRFGKYMIKILCQMIVFHFLN